MIILTDTREQAKLDFSKFNSVSTEIATLSVGDYTARFQDGSLDSSVVERKSISDLFLSYSSGYERERAKILRAKEAGLSFILAIEGTLWDIRRGHTYTVGGEEKTSKKDGLAMIRQLMTVSRKYGVILWFCQNRDEMAFYIVEHFQAMERARSKKA